MEVNSEQLVPCHMCQALACEPICEFQGILENLKNTISEFLMSERTFLNIAVWAMLDSL
jgi:hypothetical protein